MPTEEIVASVALPCAETASERLDRLGVYGEIKRELVKRGIPAGEIAFIRDFETPAQKSKAFADANAGRIRILLASTEKARTGVNMQERLYALHHLDAPWRPADVEQREGRILRQGNRYGEVRIFNYVTENSFDGYMWQTLENKAALHRPDYDRRSHRSHGRRCGRAGNDCRAGQSDCERQSTHSGARCH
ncbi:MAG: helicase-related protein [Blastocatellia bacterium]